jgi:hypothetical protein
LIEFDEWRRRVRARLLAEPARHDVADELVEKLRTSRRAILRGPFRSAKSTTAFLAAERLLVKDFDQAWYIDCREPDVARGRWNGPHDLYVFDNWHLAPDRQGLAQALADHPVDIPFLIVLTDVPGSEALPDLQVLQEALGAPLAELDMAERADEVVAAWLKAWSGATPPTPGQLLEPIQGLGSRKHNLRVADLMLRTWTAARGRPDLATLSRQVADDVQKAAPDHVGVAQRVAAVAQWELPYKVALAADAVERGSLRALAQAGLIVGISPDEWVMDPTDAQLLLHGSARGWREATVELLAAYLDTRPEAAAETLLAVLRDPDQKGWQIADELRTRAPDRARFRTRQAVDLAVRLAAATSRGMPPQAARDVATWSLHRITVVEDPPASSLQQALRALREDLGAPPAQSRLLLDPIGRERIESLISRSGDELSWALYDEVYQAAPDLAPREARAEPLHMRSLAQARNFVLRATIQPARSDARQRARRFLEQAFDHAWLRRKRELRLEDAQRGNRQARSSFADSLQSFVDASLWLTPLGATRVATEATAAFLEAAFEPDLKGLSHLVTNVRQVSRDAAADIADHIVEHGGSFTPSPGDAKGLRHLLTQMEGARPGSATALLRAVPPRYVASLLRSPEPPADKVGLVESMVMHAPTVAGALLDDAGPRAFEGLAPADRATIAALLWARGVRALEGLDAKPLRRGELTGRIAHQAAAVLAWQAAGKTLEAGSLEAYAAEAANDGPLALTLAQHPSLDEGLVAAAYETVVGHAAARGGRDEAVERATTALLLTGPFTTGPPRTEYADAFRTLMKPWRPIFALHELGLLLSEPPQPGTQATLALDVRNAEVARRADLLGDLLTAVREGPMTLAEWDERVADAEAHAHEARRMRADLLKAGRVVWKAAYREGEVTVEFAEGRPTRTAIAKELGLPAP